MTVPINDMHESDNQNGVIFIVRPDTSLNEEEFSHGAKVISSSNEHCTKDQETSDFYSITTLQDNNENHERRNVNGIGKTSSTSLILLLTVVSCVMINLKTMVDGFAKCFKLDMLYHKPKLIICGDSSLKRTLSKSSIIGALTKRFQRVVNRDVMAYILYPQDYDSFIAEKKGNVSTKESMQFEWCRLSSFATFPNSSVSVIRLAEAGFYYGGNRDEVICPFCGLKHCNWNPHDDPKHIHIEESRHLNCSFVTGKLTPAVYTGILSQHETNTKEGSTVNGHTIGATSVTFNTGSKASCKSPKNEENQSFITESTAFTRNVISTNTSTKISTGVGQETEQRTNIPEFLTETALLPHTPQNNYSTNDLTGLIRVPKDDNNGKTQEENNTPSRTQFSSLNVRSNSMGVCLDKPKYPNYAVRTTRLSSFQRWPSYLTQSPEDLAIAGFFYTGTEDHCRCFFCGGGLRRWENGDFPWTEHARWFPECQFLLQCKGQKFVNDVQHGRNPKQIQHIVRSEETNRVPNDYMNNPAVQTILELGYEQDVVISAFESLKYAGVHSISASLLLETIFELEEKGEKAPAAQHSEGNIKHESTLSGHKPLHQKKDPESVRHTDPSQELSIRSLEEENRNLKDQQICKICLDEPVAIVFLPCSHMAACVNCAPALRSCPICRAYIKGTVKAIIC